LLFFILTTRPPPTSTLFPYTTLFRSCFAIDGAPTAYPYALSVTSYNQGPTGYGLGQVQIVEHDGAGQLRFDDRPFVLLETRGLRSEEHTSELQSPYDLVCRLLLEKKK